MKSTIKNSLPEPLWDYLRYWYYRILRRGYFGHNGLDKKLKKYLSYNNGFFVELGANNGFTQSNTLHFEIFKNWRGILIEPCPNLFLSCLHFRGRHGNKIFCNACVPFGYSDRYVEIYYANVMSLSSNLEHDIDNIEDFVESAKNVARKNHSDLRFGAVAKTLTQILEDSKAPDVIDFLSLDVEGAELDVLKGVDFQKYVFKYMLIECRKFERLEEFLEKHGYEMIEKLSHHDYLFSNKKAVG